MKLVLNNYVISSLSITNNHLLEGEHTIQFSHRAEYSHPSDGKYSVRCTGMICLENEIGTNEKTFSVEMSLIGYFTYTGKFAGDDSVNKACIKELLPLLRAHIATSMASIGMSPIVIPASTDLE